MYVISLEEYNPFTHQFLCSNDLCCCNGIFYFDSASVLSKQRKVVFTTRLIARLTAQSIVIKELVAKRLLYGNNIRKIKIYRIKK